MFKCPFCNHDASCEVKLDRAAETGNINCRVCGETFQCRVTYMSDPVDVFCEWVDELERARGGGASGAAAAAGRRDSVDAGIGGGSAAGESEDGPRAAAVGGAGAAAADFVDADA